MDQTPKGIPEEVTGVAMEEIKAAPPISVEPVPEELRPVVDKSAQPPPCEATEGVDILDFLVQ